MMGSIVPRLFVALPLPESALAALAPLCSGLRGARWVAAERQHLTLEFVGAVDGPMARRVEQTLGAVRAATFTLRLRGLGHFPPRGAPRVVWAGLPPSEPLARLQRDVRGRLLRLGLPLERRRFAPHITLARLQGTRPADVLEHRLEHGGLDGPDLPVPCFSLFASVLGRDGAVHRPLASYPLA
ncbi:MAG: RNA 2',3'-cyclic phosphodiesterase [Planctomycetota bacterium]|nr:MAG: RNA 2',3'-cyclic phosphodiesterase [Planctomycetota bacterium]